MRMAEMAAEMDEQRDLDDFLCWYDEQLNKEKQNGKPLYEVAQPGCVEAHREKEQSFLSFLGLGGGSAAAARSAGDLGI
jgi:hypothetical protein